MSKTTNLVIDTMNEEKQSLIYPSLAKKAGLSPSWKNDDGEIEYIGTDKQWAEYERLEAESDKLNFIN